MRLAKESIRQGDIFQIVLSRNFSIKTSSDPFDIYRALKYSNPSPYMFYIEADDYAIAGASPEKLISIDDQVVSILPARWNAPQGYAPG